MTVKKIALVDVDGTLVDYDGNLPQSAVDAVRAARANGAPAAPRQRCTRTSWTSAWTA